jgi:hypothetical protein
MRWRTAVTIAAALFVVVAAPALAQNSESAPHTAAAPMKPKPKTPADGRGKKETEALLRGLAVSSVNQEAA